MLREINKTICSIWKLGGHIMITLLTLVTFSCQYLKPDNAFIK